MDFQRVWFGTNLFRILFGRLGVVAPSILAILGVLIVATAGSGNWQGNVARAESGVDDSKTAIQDAPAGLDEALPSSDNAVLDEQFSKIAKPFLKKYCFQCHTSNRIEGGLDLDEFRGIESVLDSLDQWSEIAEAIESEYMPPDEDEVPRPTASERKSIVNWIEGMIAGQSLALPVPRMRRFNRVEYENTVESLLKFKQRAFFNPTRVVQLDDYFKPETGRMPKYVLGFTYIAYSHRFHSVMPGLTSPPTDPPIEHGFTNNHLSLSTSPVLLEKYFNLADTIVTNPRLRYVSELWDEFLYVHPSNLINDMKRHVREQLEPFLTRAFRRPVKPSELEIFCELFNRELDQTGSYEKSLQTTMTAVLVSPSFLFRDDLSLSTDSFRSNRSYAMASRLSYFLWGTMPDDILFQAAAEGKLETKEQLLSQVDRMMKDKRVKSLATDFGMQWLRLSKVLSAMPDKKRFPEFFTNKLAPITVSMMVEQLLLFETIMVEDRSVLDFITANFTFVNRDLMDWYELDPKQVLGYVPPKGTFEDFYRIRWPNVHRGGIIASGAMLISTSTPTRTSPVYRGAWILDVVFNRPPPPPPADVPALEEEEMSNGKIQFKNIRERLDKHREDPACANCHDRIDPAGYAFEKFDSVARWRKSYDDGGEIRPGGKLNGIEFQGAAQFKRMVVREKRMFVRAFVEHMLKYALGRSLEVADQTEIDRIVEAVIQQDCRFSAVVKEIVLSKQFTLFDENINAGTRIDESFETRESGD